MSEKEKMLKGEMYFPNDGEKMKYYIYFLIR